jgi:putative hydrolase of the HAD superfamily
MMNRVSEAHAAFEVRVLMVDVDGVLIRGRPGDGLHWSTGLEADLNLSFATLLSQFFHPYWQAIVTGKDNLRPRLRHVLHEIAPHVTADELIDYWFRNDAGVDAVLLLELTKIKAAGVEVHLATNQEYERARYLLETLGLGMQVHRCHYSADIGWRKPDPEFFGEVVRRTGLAPSSLLLLDDAEENVRAAILAGWNAMQWTGTDSSFEILRGYIPDGMKPAGAVVPPVDAQSRQSDLLLDKSR